MTYRLGVDVGGTFTDLLLVNEETGETWRAKTPSTPADQSVGVLHGIEHVCRLAGIGSEQVGEVLHGTTVATNAILEGKGATVGLVTTEGFRQVLQIARSFVPGGLAGWIIWPKPEPLAALENTVEVASGSAARRGRPRARRGRRARAAAQAGARRRGADRQPDQLLRQRRARAAHRARSPPRSSPELPVSLSSAVLPEMREYERTITTVANAYVQPQVARYVSSLSRASSRARDRPASSPCCAPTAA